MKKIIRNISIAAILIATIITVRAQALVVADNLVVAIWSAFHVTALTTSTVSVGSGATISGIITTNVSVDIGSTATNVTSTATVTLTGATTNDVVMFNLVSPHTSFRYDAFITAADTITVYASNISITNNINPAATDARFTVIKY